MAYSFTNSKGVTYYLHTRRTMAASGKERVLYFFAKEIKDGAMDAVPMGYDVVEMKTGLPVLKKAAQAPAAPAPEPPTSTPQF